MSKVFETEYDRIEKFDHKTKFYLKKSDEDPDNYIKLKYLEDYIKMLTKYPYGPVYNGGYVFKFIIGETSLSINIYDKPIIHGKYYKVKIAGVYVINNTKHLLSNFKMLISPDRDYRPIYYGIGGNKDLNIINMFFNKLGKPP